MSHRYQRLACMVLFVCSTFVIHPSHAQTIYKGSWVFEWDRIALADENRRGTLSLSLTKKRCGGARTSSETLQTFFNGIDGKVRWYIDKECRDDYLRICILNHLNVATCGTFKSEGWT